MTPTPLVHSREEVTAILAMMRNTGRIDHPPLQELIQATDRARAHVMEYGNGGEFAWSNWYLRVGKCALLMRARQFPQAQDNDLAALLMEKHKRYGVEVLTRWMHLGMVVKIDLKVQRIINILKDGGPRKGDEQDLCDNIGDIANYCVLGRALRMKYQ